MSAGVFADDATALSQSGTEPLQQTVREKSELLASVCADYAIFKDAIQTLDVTMTFEKRLLVKGGRLRIVGNMVVRDDEPSTVIRHSTGIAHYVHDRRSERIYGEIVENDTPTFVDPATGDVVEEVVSKNAARWNITPERFAHVNLITTPARLPKQPGVLGSPGIGPVVEFKHPSHVRRDLDLLLLPSMWYSVNFLLIPPAEVFSSWIKEMNAGTASTRQQKFFEQGLSISDSAKILKVTMANPDTPEIPIAVFEFDKSQQHLPTTAWHSSKYGSTDRYIWKWQKIEEDVYCLQEYKLEQYDAEEVLGYSLKMSLRNFEINAPIDERLFKTEYLTETPEMLVDE